MTARMNLRLYGVLSKRLDDVAFDLVRDDRDPRGMRWRLGALLRAVTGAMLGGAKSLAEAEALSERMSTPIRKLLGIGRRAPDTTLRDALTSVEPMELKKRLHALVRAAQHRKALDPDDLPFGVASLDGKGFSIPAADDWFAQRQTRPIVDVFSIPAHMSEMGSFEPALAALCEAWRQLRRDGASAGTCANFVGSCRLVPHQCRDIGGVGNTLLFAQNSCKAPSIWSTSPCPNAEAGAGTEKVGGCKFTGSAATFYYKEADCMINWFYPPSTAPIPASLCTGGTVIPP